ncbi:MAG: hypothetical protein ACU0DK_17215 [Pseudooceanicola sp.]
MKQTDKRTDAPLSRFLKPARAARDGHFLHSYRRSLLARGGSPKGILAVPHHNPAKARAEAIVFGHNKPG